jgi:hypothetical protein
MIIISNLSSLALVLYDPEGLPLTLSIATPPSGSAGPREECVVARIN